MKNTGMNVAAPLIIEADMAWDYNVCPGRIIFNHKVSKYHAQRLLDAVGEHFPELRKIGNVSLASLKPLSDLSGHFCLAYGKKKLFLRVSRRQRKNPELEERIARYLSSAGIEALVPLVSGLTLHFEGRDYLLSIFPFVNGRHFDGSDEDLRSISSVLARLHKALKTFKFNNQVRAASLKTAHRLLEAKEKIAYAFKLNDFSVFYELSNWAKVNKDWLKVMIKEFNPYLCLLEGAQCLHGELHTGNVIFSLEESAVILTDFEECPDAWFPPSFDLVYLIHRFCMYENPSSSVFQKRINIVKEAYGRLPSNIQEMMRQVCWYLVALIIDRCFRRESFAPDEECDKFVRLEKLSHALSLSASKSKQKGIE